MKEEDLNPRCLAEKIKPYCVGTPHPINELDILLALKGMTNTNPKHPFVRKLYIESLKWFDENNFTDENFNLKDSLNYLDTYNMSTIERFIRRMARENNEEVIHNSTSFFGIFEKH